MVKYTKTGKTVVLILSLPIGIEDQNAKEYIYNSKTGQFSDTEYVGNVKNMTGEDWLRIVDGTYEQGFKNYLGGDNFENPKDSGTSLLNKADILIRNPLGERAPEKCECLKGNIVCHIPSCEVSQKYGEWWANNHKVFSNLHILVRKL